MTCWSINLATKLSRELSKMCCIMSDNMSPVQSKMCCIMTDNMSPVQCNIVKFDI